MGFEEMVIGVIGAIGAFALVGFLAAKVFDLIKAWINRDKGGYDEETFNRLATAFMQHKKNTEQRLKNLEAIIAEEDGPQAGEQQTLSEPQQTIEIEEEEQSREKDQSGDDGNLRNMLKN